MQRDAPAAQAGHRAGDVITAVNGTTVKNPRDLAVNIAAVQPGDEAKLQVLHDGDSKTVTVKVGQLPNEQMANNESQPAVSASGSGWRWHRCRRTCAVSSTCRTAQGRGGARRASRVRRQSRPDCSRAT